MPGQYYKRTRGIFSPHDKAPFKVSRSKIDLFLECPRCFYLDRRHGTPRPSGFPFTLNSAVDALLKKEFDIHRRGATTHPLMEQYGIDAIPFTHEKMDEWRENFVGIQHVHPATNLTVTGAVDDIWVTPRGELIVVDYKSTSKDTEVNLDAEWQDGYKRQMEVYQWLLRQIGFEVSDTGYFVYANGQKDRKAFDGKLEFAVTIIPYTGSDRWIEKTLHDLKKCLMSPEVPASSRDCEYCAYIKTVNDTIASVSPAESAPEFSPASSRSSSPKKSAGTSTILGTEKQIARRKAAPRKKKGDEDGPTPIGKTLF